LVPVEPVDLQPGHLYEVEVQDTQQAPESRSPQALVQLLRSLPKIPPEYVDEMEAEIKRGELPVSYEDPFGNEQED
jgi:hypothetical protein